MDDAIQTEERKMESSAVTKIEPRHDVPAPITPMQMLQIAVEQNADLDKLSKLMDLQERWEANEARKEFVAAKAAFKAEAPTILKNKHVGFESRKTDSRTDYDHATLDNVADTLSPLLSEHGLSYSWETEQTDGGMIRVTCVLTHVRGHSERVSLQAGADNSGNKNPIQAIGSTVTFLQRYTLLAATGTATKGQDDDGSGSETTYITDTQVEEIMKEVTEVGADANAFLEYLGADGFTKIPAKKYGMAKAALDKKRKAKK